MDVAVAAQVGVEWSMEGRARYGHSGTQQKMDEARRTEQTKGPSPAQQHPRDTISANRTAPIGKDGHPRPAAGIQGHAVGDSSSRTERMLIISLAVTLDKIRDKAGPEAVNELIAILRNDQFSIPMFKQMINCSEDCKTITDDVIKQWKHTYLD